MGEAFDTATSMQGGCRSIRKCKNGVSRKSGPMHWYLHRMTKAERLNSSVLEGAYHLMPGTTVQIYRPKRREAKAPHFQDRVWQRSMCDAGVYADLTRGLCYDNAACQKDKGTDLAIRRTIHFLQRIYRTTGSNEGWGVHRDVRKYFPSTPHQSIKDRDRLVITEPLFLPYLDEIVDSQEDPRDPAEVAADPFGARGTGLGSQINQLHQVSLLSPLDHELKTFCKYSQRYMDDFQVLDPDKSVCLRAGAYIDRALAERGFISTDKGGVFRLKDGFWFLRHFFLLTDTGKVILRLHPDTLRNERAALKGMRAALDRGEITMDNVRQHYQSFIAQAEYSSGDGATRDMDRFYTLTFREKPTYKRKRRYFYGHRQRPQSAAPGGAAEERTAPGTGGQTEGDSGLPWCSGG